MKQKWLLDNVSKFKKNKDNGEKSIKMRDSLLMDPPILNGRLLEDEFQKNVSNEENILSLNEPPVSFFLLKMTQTFSFS